MYSCLKDTVFSASAIMALVAFANVFAFILTKEHIPSMIADAMLRLTTNKYLILLLINLFLIFVGMFMETIAAILILFPTLLAVATAVGADLLNDAHVLVADDAGIGGSGIGAMIDAHVGAADTGSDHADQNIVFLVDLRLLEINDLQFIRFNDLNTLHKIFLLKSDNGLKDFDDLSARWADGSGPCWH